MIKRWVFFCISLWIPFFCRGEVVHFDFDGYLGEVELAATKQKLLDLNIQEVESIHLRLNSTMGDFTEVYRIAEALVSLRDEHHKPIIVEIDYQAVGSAAMLPFLATELHVAEHAVWGDIPYGSQPVSLTQMNEMVLQLIPKQSEDYETLEQLAHAMIDSYSQIAGQHGGFGPLIIGTKEIKQYDLIEGRDIHPSKRSRHIQSDFAERVQESFAEYPERENHFGYISLKNKKIDLSLFIQIQESLNYFQKNEVKGIILDMDLSDGDSLSALKIANLLQHFDVRNKIPIFCYINTKSMYLAPLLAYSCRFIIAKEKASFGGGSWTHKPRRELVEAFVSHAEFFFRNPAVAEAMVNPDITLILQDHQIVSLKEKNVQKKERILHHKGSYLTLDGRQLFDFGVADAIINNEEAMTLTEEEKEKGFWPASSSPLFSLAPFASFSDAEMIAYHSWKIPCFQFLTHPLISALLLMILIVAFYVEISSPGFGWPGVIGILALFSILAISFVIHTFDWIEFIFLGIGLILLMIELFVIPGFGIVGILGILFTTIGLVTLMLPGIGAYSLFHIETYKFVGNPFIQRLIYLIFALLIAFLLILFLARRNKKKYHTLEKMVRKGKPTPQNLLDNLEENAIPKKGQMGVSITDLAPTGTVHIGNREYYATTQGESIKKGMPISVVAIEGQKVVVKGEQHT